MYCRNPWLTSPLLPLNMQLYVCNLYTISAHPLQFHETSANYPGDIFLQISLHEAKFKQTCTSFRNPYKLSCKSENGKTLHRKHRFSPANWVPNGAFKMKGMNWWATRCTSRKVCKISFHLIFIWELKQCSIQITSEAPTTSRSVDI